MIREILRSHLLHWKLIIDIDLLIKGVLLHILDILSYCNCWRCFVHLMNSLFSYEIDVSINVIAHITSQILNCIQFEACGKLNLSQTNLLSKVICFSLFEYLVASFNLDLSIFHFLFH